MWAEVKLEAATIVRASVMAVLRVLMLGRRASRNLRDKRRSQARTWCGRVVCKSFFLQKRKWCWEQDGRGGGRENVGGRVGER